MFDEALKSAGGHGPAGIFNDPGVDWYHGFAPSLQVYKPMLDNPAMYSKQPAAQSAEVMAAPVARPGILHPANPADDVRAAVEEASRDANQYYDTMSNVFAGSAPYITDQQLQLVKKHTPEGLDIPWPGRIAVVPHTDKGWRDRSYYKGGNITLYPNSRLHNATYGNDTAYGYFPVWSGGDTLMGGDVLAHELGHFYDASGLYGANPIPNLSIALNSLNHIERALSPAFSELAIKAFPGAPEWVTNRPHEPFADQFATALRLTAAGGLDPRVAPRWGVKQPDVDQLQVQNAGRLYDLKKLLLSDSGKEEARKRLLDSTGSADRETVPVDKSNAGNIQRALLYDLLRRPLGYPSAIQQTPPPPDDGVLRVKATTAPKR